MPEKRDEGTLNPNLSTRVGFSSRRLSRFSDGRQKFEDNAKKNVYHLLTQMSAMAHTLNINTDNIHLSDLKPKKPGSLGSSPKSGEKG